jgi:hypothetical protein
LAKRKDVIQHVRTHNTLGKRKEVIQHIRTGNTLAKENKSYNI